MHRSLIAVGLEPAFGYFHQPQSAAPPLVLDVMERFRTVIWDIPWIGAGLLSGFRELFDEAPANAIGRSDAAEFFRGIVRTQCVPGRGT